jgi:hypothetical protein
VILAINVGGTGNMLFKFACWYSHFTLRLALISSPLRTSS